MAYNGGHILWRHNKMIELSVLSVFAAALVFCIGYDISILMALIFGFFLFSDTVCTKSILSARWLPWPFPV